MASDQIFTIGHSSHEFPEFLALLRRQAIARVADVRRFPGSRRLPQFNSGDLSGALGAEGVDYVHLKDLGGRRPPLADSPNGGWHNDGFQGYADHMASGEFAAALERLEELGRERPTAIMCAEGQWVRCHRRLISDALLARGWRVLHVGTRGGLEEHALTPFATATEGALSYPPEQESLDV